MPSNQGAAYILCPLFRSQEGLCIGCEGFHEEQSVTLRFRQRSAKRTHVKTFCEARYPNCEMYRAVVLARYTDEE